jgi:putative addiction module component (TIGR02574 family)
MSAPNNRRLPTDPESELSEAWASEISRRLQEIRDGTVELVSYDEVKRRIQEERAARRATKR